MKLFDFLDVFFGTNNKKIYKTINNNKRGDQYFMLNRVISVKQPNLANALNHLRINTGQVVNTLYDMYGSQVQGYKKGDKWISKPKWIMAITTKSKEVKKPTTIYELKPNDMKLYKSTYGYTNKEINRLAEICLDELNKDLKAFEKGVSSEIKKVR